MNQNAQIVRTSAYDLATVNVLRNTYALLAMTIMFSAVTAAVSMQMRVPYLGLWVLLPYFVLLFLVEKNKNSAAGLAGIVTRFGKKQLYGKIPL